MAVAVVVGPRGTTVSSGGVSASVGPGGGQAGGALSVSAARGGVGSAS